MPDRDRGRDDRRIGRARGRATTTPMSTGVSITDSDTKLGNAIRTWLAENNYQTGDVTPIPPDPPDPPDPTPDPDAVYLYDIAPFLEHWGATREVADYDGPAFQINCAGGLIDIGWDGKTADAAALTAALAGGQGTLARVYGQRGVTDLIASGTRPPVFVDDDGLVAFGSGSNMALFAEKPATLRSAKVHIFMTAKLGMSDLTKSLNPAANAQVLATYQGPGTWWQVARYGLQLSDAGYAEMQMPQNGQSSGWQSQIGQGCYSQAHKGKYTVWGWSNNTREVRADKTVCLSPQGSKDITYSGDGKFIVGNDDTGTLSLRGPWRALAFYDATQDATKWDAIVAHYCEHADIGVQELPTEVETDNAPGFIWTPTYIPGYYDRDPVDRSNIAWNDQHGGYPWSLWTAANVSNGVDYVRFENRFGDSDIIVNAANRTEQAGFIGGNTTSTGIILPGDDFDSFWQFLFEPGPPQTKGDWIDVSQFHYDDTGSTQTPDLFLMDLKGEKMQPATQRQQTDGSRTPRGTSIPIERGVWYACRILGHWSKDRQSDTLQIWLGKNGAPLAKTADASGGIFDTTAKNAYAKRGIYRGFASNVAGNLAMQMCNFKLSKTRGAFAGLVNAQPPLPLAA